MIETNNYNRCVEADKIMPSVTAGPLKPNDWNALEIIEGFAHLYDNTNVILGRLGPEYPEQATYIATTDYPLVNKIDPDTLAVTGSHRPPVTDGISMSSCSHWTREIGTDNSLNFHMMYNPWTMKPDFVLYRYQDKVEEKVEIGRFGLDFISYIHMMSTTPNYAVVVVYPVSMDFNSLFEHNMHPIETITYMNVSTKIVLMDLQDGTVIDGFETNDPKMVFATHIINSWE